MSAPLDDCTCAGDPREPTDEYCEHEPGCPVYRRWRDAMLAARPWPRPVPPDPDPRRQHTTDERRRGPVRSRDGKPL